MLNKNFPVRVERGFPGKRVESNLAGIMATALGTYYFTIFTPEVQEKLKVIAY
jgi:hypothetical protein